MSSAFMQAINKGAFEAGLFATSERYFIGAMHLFP